MSDQQQPDPRQAADLARHLFPDLAAALDRALEQSLERDPAAGGKHGSGSDGFEAQLGAEVGRFQNRHAALAWHDVTDDTAREAVLASFEAAREVLRDSTFELPAPESFAAIVDLVGFADRHTPGYAVVPAPHGLGLEGWRQLFQLAADRHPSRLNPSEPLIVATEAVREFTLLDSVGPGGIGFGGAGFDGAGLGGARTGDAATGSDGVRWTLRLVPAGPAPALLGLNFEHGPHVTLPEMLMLQLMRIAAGEEPLDQASFTWLAGELVGGKLAARHVYDAADLAVRVSCREIGNQGPHLGARAPIGLAG